MTPATHRQLVVLTLLRISPQPTVRELADLLGVASTNGVNDHLKALAKRGLIQRPRRKSRSIRITAAGSRALAGRAA